MIEKGNVDYIADGDERRETTIGEWHSHFNHKVFMVRGLMAIQSFI